jgi:5-methylcytosine-specific restriction enzyme A
MAPRFRLLEQRTALPPAKAVDPFYISPEWRALMAEIIAERGRRCEDPQCQRRLDQSIGAPTRVYGDHIVELRDGGAPLDKRNVMLRCGSCHTRKTAEARAIRTARKPF